MKKIIIVIILGVAFIIAINSESLTILNHNSSYDNNAKFVNHNILLTIQPDKSYLNVTDIIKLPNSFKDEFEFIINQNLNIKTTDSELQCKNTNSGYIPLKKCIVKLNNTKTFQIEYEGIINYPLRTIGSKFQKGYEYTPGIISPEGVYLSRDSYWYPIITTNLITFTINVEVPKNWEAISQGERIFHKKDTNKTTIIWNSLEPQEEIILTAGKFFEFSKPEANFVAMVFLRTYDKELADKYLDATIKFIKMYEKLIGKYPYKKFALVENFWESGFGMPSFTLLGSKIIRFPFIIYSSYPHEILHNWFGNGIFLDPESGNWTEGLTAYLSDHLLKENESSGEEYRLSNLQKYFDYVTKTEDFPLKDFKQKYSSPSEAIGYSKSMMFFHMLRLEIGDKNFIDGLREFYRENIFKLANFKDLKRCFEKVSNKSLDSFFNQWLNRIGAPEIIIKNINLYKLGDAYEIKITLEQIQEDEPFMIKIPIAIYLNGNEYAQKEILIMKKKVSDYILKVNNKPLKIIVDPEFDVFRRLNKEESPPTISQILGSKNITVFLPSSYNKYYFNKVRELFSNLSNDNINILYDKNIEKLPNDTSIIIVGWENILLEKINELFKKHDIELEHNKIRIKEHLISKINNILIITLRNPNNIKHSILFIGIGTNDLESLDMLLQKLSHYHKYSYLAFEDKGLKNILKGNWNIESSPLAFSFFTNNESKSIKNLPELKKRNPLISYTH